MAEKEPIRQEETQPNPLVVRSFAPADLETVVAIAHKNFEGHSYSLLPDEVVNAYKRANSPEELRDAMAKPGTETYVVEDKAGEVSGYFFLRYHGKSGAQQAGAYGELDLRRTQVDSDKQGQGIATTIIKAVEQRGRELGASTISTQGGGASRDYFERQGWKGRTVLNGMKPIPAIAFACSKEIGEQTREVYTRPQQLIVASTSPRKVNLVRSLVGMETPVIPSESEEEETNDVVQAAMSKALSVEANLTRSRKNSAIVSTDVRTDIMVYNSMANSFSFENKGKPKTPEEAISNFAAMAQIAEATNKPVPYVVRRATVILNPDTRQQPLISEKDISVWLTPEALKFLSDPEGFAQYRQAVLDKYGRDVMQNAASFALQIFVEKGMVAGMNGYLFDKIPRRDNFLKQAESIVYGAPDPALLNERLGIHTK